MSAYNATNHRNNLPFHAMCGERAQFRAIAAALIEAADNHSEGERVTVTVDGFTVTTTTPIAAAAKYTKAAKKAVKRRVQQSKCTPADDAHYERINGQPALISEEQTELLPSLQEDEAMAKPQFDAAEVSEACKARAAMKAQVAATLAKQNRALAEELQAELDSSIAKADSALDTLSCLAQAEPEPEAEPAPQAKPAPKAKPAKNTLADFATLHDMAPAAHIDTITNINNHYNQRTLTNPLAAVAALYDVTTQSAERVKLAQLSEQYQAPTQATPTQATPTQATPAQATQPQPAPINFAPIKTAVARAVYTLAAVFTVFVIAA